MYQQPLIVTTISPQRRIYYRCVVLVLLLVAVWYVAAHFMPMKTYTLKVGTLTIRIGQSRPTILSEKRDEVVATSQIAEEVLVAPLACPLASCWQSGTGYSSEHPGIDLGANLGDPVYATMSGVAHNSETWPCGNGVSVTNGDMMTLMCHLSAFAVEDGATVRAGDQVGNAGESGQAYGVHVHYEIRENGINLDPSYVVK